MNFQDIILTLQEYWKEQGCLPSRRPADGRYGQNPNRLRLHHQYQVIIKPSPDDIQSIYLESLKRLGVNFLHHDIRFVEDDWKSPTLGAWGLGWQVNLDGMEITQFTYFQQVGGFNLKPIPVELTYGLERIAMCLQGIDNVYDLKWNSEIAYGDICYQGEVEFSRYNFEEGFWIKGLLCQLMIILSNAHILLTCWRPEEPWG